jgi:hypothetical protein
VLSLLGDGGPSLQISPHQVLAILDAHDTDWRAVAGRYFQNIHPWYGAVHAPVFQLAYGCTPGHAGETTRGETSGEITNNDF